MSKEYIEQSIKHIELFPSRKQMTEELVSLKDLIDPFERDPIQEIQWS